MTSKMYIAILDEAPDYMVPTLVAHTILNADKHFMHKIPLHKYRGYMTWKRESFKKVTLRVNRTEYDKIKDQCIHYEGYESTICNGEGSCLIVLPMEDSERPNVIKFAKLWKPKDNLKQRIREHKLKQEIKERL